MKHYVLYDRTGIVDECEVEEIPTFTTWLIQSELSDIAAMTDGEVQKRYAVDERHEAITGMIEYYFYESGMENYSSFIDELLYRGIINNINN